MTRPRLVGLLLAGIGLLGLALGSGQLGTAAQSGLEAAFAITPNDPDINTMTTLDASASRAPDGRIHEYAWDLDEDGTFERTSEDPTLSHLFDASGSHTITLRVTDAQDRTSTVARTVEVADAPVRVRRSIETPIEGRRVTAGRPVEVTVTIAIREPVNGLGLDEAVPDTWRVSGVANDGAAFKPDEAQWLWFGELSAGESRTVVYEAIPTADAVNETVTIDGTLSSFSPRIEIVIPGDRRVRVI